MQFTPLKIPDQFINDKRRKMYLVRGFQFICLLSSSAVFIFAPPPSSIAFLGRINTGFSL